MPFVLRSRILPLRCLRVICACLGLLLAASSVQAQSITVLRVDAGNTSADCPAGVLDGSSWDCAYSTLQDAIAATPTGAAAATTEIWMAEGVYRPDAGAGVAGGTTDTSFVITGARDGLALYGGFDGTEADREQRAPDAHRTVLSGDVDDDDDTNVVGVTEMAGDQNGTNAVHVVAFDGTTAAGPITTNTVLDGVTVTAGRAVGAGDDGFGGGVFCNGGGSGHACSPTLTRIRVQGNTADFGGGLYSGGPDGGESRLRVSEAVISGNDAEFLAGGLYNHGSGGGLSSPVLTNTAVVDNRSTAVVNDGTNGVSSPTLTAVAFVDNLGDDGGALLNRGTGGGESSPTLTNVLFAGNVAGNGAALYNDGQGTGSAATPTITNTTFSGNTATGRGGAIYGIATNGGTSTPQITNTIFFGNVAISSGDAIFNAEATPRLRYTLVEGGCPARSDCGDGSTILEARPLFVDPNAPAGDDGRLGTGDDGLRVGDGSPVLDAGDNGAVASPSTDLAGRARITDNDDDPATAPRVDLGAYEAGPGTQLPVELTGVDATSVEEGTRLTWQTASETNNAGFDVQRRVKPSWPDGSTPSSDPMGEWQTVGSVDGAGTTTEARSYAFTDEGVPYDADSLTYRLKQIDTDGTTSYSDPVTVARSAVRQVRLLGTYPNPTRGRATVRFAVPGSASRTGPGGAGQKVTLRLYDVLGRQVRTVWAGAEPGRHELQLDTSRLPSGTYFLRLQVGATTRTQQVTVVQ